MPHKVSLYPCETRNHVMSYYKPFMPERKMHMLALVKSCATYDRKHHVSIVERFCGAFNEFCCKTTLFISIKACLWQAAISTNFQSLLPTSKIATSAYFEISFQDHRVVDGGLITPKVNFLRKKKKRKKIK